MTNPDQLKNKRILVVEDEFLLADDLAKTIARRGATLIGPVASVPAGLSVAGDTKVIDAAILDINLRNVLSYPIAEILQDRGVPFLFTTGYDHELVPEKFHHIRKVHKPYDQQEVVDRLAELIS